MAKCPRYRWIPAAAAEIDAEYPGYKGGPYGPNTTCFGTVVNKGNGVGWLWGDENRKVEDILFFQHDFTWEEEEAWYRDHFDINNPKTVNNLMGLFTNLYNTGDAYHEMWNGWVGTNFYEMAGELEDETFYLVGIAPIDWQKDDIFGKGKSVAFVACYYDSDEQFWCHGSQDWVDDMREQMQDIYNKLIETVGDIDDDI